MPVLGIITAAFLTVCYSVWVMHEYAKRRKEKVKKLGDSLRRLDEAVAAAAREENRRFRKAGINTNWEQEDYWENNDWFYTPGMPGSIYDIDSRY